MVQDPNFLTTRGYMNKVKPEAKHTLCLSKARVIVNVERNEQLPAMVERLFQWWRANIDMIPVMNFEELKNGLKSR